MSDQVELSVVVPCWDERDAILETIDALRRVLRECEPFELIVVDDGSTDGSGELLAEAEASGRYPELLVVRHERNLGYGAALKTGIRRARGPIVAITDADGTYPNDRLPELVSVLRDRALDMVVGSRTAPEGVTYPFTRRIPKTILRAWVSFLVGVSVPDMNSGMRVFRKDAVLRFISILPEGFSFTTTITLAMLRNHYAVQFEPIGYAARVGKSKIQPIRDTLRFTQLILRTGMYFAPLRVLTPLVLVLSTVFAISAGYDVFVLRDLTDTTVILLMFTINTAIFGLLADMIVKRADL